MQCSLFITSDSLCQVESHSSRGIKIQINWNSVKVFCLIKTIMYNSFTLISLKQTAAEPLCVTVGSGGAVPRNCQNLRSSVATYVLQNRGPRNGRNPPSCCIKGWVSCRWEFESESSKVIGTPSQPFPTSNLNQSCS